jgi:hypothetical protein
VRLGGEYGGDAQLDTAELFDGQHVTDFMKKRDGWLVAVTRWALTLGAVSP